MTYAASLLVAAHTAVRDHILAGTGNLAAFRVYDAGNTLLVTLPLDAATVGTVNGTTGQITLTPGADGAPVAGGTADHAELYGNDGGLMKSAIPVATGTAAQSGYLVLSSTTIAVGTDVRIISATIG